METNKQKNEVPSVAINIKQSTRTGRCLSATQKVVFEEGTFAAMKYDDVCFILNCQRC